MTEVLAPIDDIEVWIAESWPPQYLLHVVSGLPNGCTRFDSYNIIRKGETIRVEVINLQPADSGIGCPAVYGFVEHINLRG